MKNCANGNFAARSIRCYAGCSFAIVISLFLGPPSTGLGCVLIGGYYRGRLRRSEKLGVPRLGCLQVADNSENCLVKSKTREFFTLSQMVEPMGVEPTASRVRLFLTFPGLPTPARNIHRLRPLTNQQFFPR